MKSALNQDALRQVVLEQQEETVRFQQLPLIERDQTQALLDILDKPWVKIVTGIRRCGKSMLIHQALKGRVYSYLNFDDERLIGIEAADLNLLLQFLLEATPNARILFFDEIQNVDGWELFVNRLQRQGYNIVITGSNSKLLSKELSTHLTGRHISIELTPFSFREFLRAKKFDLGHLSTTQQKAALFVLLENYLHTGGFPDMATSDYNALYLRELYDKIISRDITYRYHVKYSKTLKEIAIYSHASLGSRLTFHKVKNIFDITSVHTVKNYFQYLADAYLVFLLPAFSHKHKEQIKQPRKTYTLDNGLSAAINPKFAQDRGAALENLVFQELQRRTTEFSYYATSDCEVDFVVHQSKQVSSLIQVAYSLEDPDTKKREIKALIKAAAALRCNRLLILTWNEEDTLEIDNQTLAVIPIWKWLLKPHTTEAGAI